MSNCYGGIDLGGSFIKAGLLSPKGQPIDKFIVPARVDDGISVLKENLRQVGSRLIYLARERGYRLLGIGIGSPGTIKYPIGIVTGATPNIPGWIGTNISKIFRDFRIPVAVDNDANCMGLAESLFGAGRGTSSGFYLTLGTGIGGAIVLNGHLVRGASFCAGEFGHTIFKYNGARYITGRRGCLEAYIASPALVRAARKQAARHHESLLVKTDEQIEPKSIFKAFKDGDPAAVRAVSENAAMIGVAIGSVVNLLNPEIVVIGGGMSLGGRRYINLIKKSVFGFAFESTAQILKIKTAKFGNEAGWIGAACLNIKLK